MAYWEFKPQKAVEEIIYFSEKLNALRLPHLYRLMYFADKTSLERYGRFICGATYVAEKEGPMPIEVQELIQMPDSPLRWVFAITEQGALIPSYIVI